MYSIYQFYALLKDIVVLLGNAIKTTDTTPNILSHTYWQNGLGTYMYYLILTYEGQSLLIEKTLCFIHEDRPLLSGVSEASDRYVGLNNKVPDGSVVRTSVSGTWNALFMIQRSRVWTQVRSNLGCVVLLNRTCTINNKAFRWFRVHRKHKGTSQCYNPTKKDRMYRVFMLQQSNIQLSWMHNHMIPLHCCPVYNQSIKQAIKQ